MGKPVSVIRSSKFCLDTLIDYSNRARSLFTIPIEDSIKRRELVSHLFSCTALQIIIQTLISILFFCVLQSLLATNTKTNH